MNKLDNIKCIAANFLRNNLADQFREKLPAIRNRRGDGGTGIQYYLFGTYLPLLGS